MESRESRAILRYSGIPPRKMRQVADLVRGQDVDVALHSLMFLSRAAALPMRKLIQSAAANARERAATEERKFDADRLFIKAVNVDEGPTLKRWRPRAQGRAFRINKRTCHVAVVLDEYEEDEAPKAKPTKAKADAEQVADKAEKKKGRKAKAKTVEAAK